MRMNDAASVTSVVCNVPGQTIDERIRIPGTIEARQGQALTGLAQDVWQLQTMPAGR